MTINPDALRAACIAADATYQLEADDGKAFERAIASAIEAYRAALPPAAGEPVASTPKPPLWDLSQLLRHAFLSGRGAGECLSDDDRTAWMNYDPEKLSWYGRLIALLTAPDAVRRAKEVDNLKKALRAAMLHTHEKYDTGGWRAFAHFALGEGHLATLPAGEHLDADAVREAVMADIPAWHDVIAERQRQVSAEGWTPEHDDSHPNGELAQAASCYALHSRGVTVPLHQWPWHHRWWKPSTPRRDLVKAAALLLAEIERLDRAAIRARPAP